MKTTVKRLSIEVEFLSESELRECLEIVVKEYRDGRLGGFKQRNGYSYKTMISFPEDEEVEYEEIPTRIEEVNGVKYQIIPSRLNYEDTGEQSVSEEGND